MTKSIYRLINIVLFLSQWYGLSSCSSDNVAMEQDNCHNIVTQNTIEFTHEKPGFIRFENKSSASVEFNFTINNKFWFTISDLIAFINTMECDVPVSIPDNVFKAAVLINDYSSHQQSIEVRNDVMTNPIVFLNSIGNGLCDDRSGALVQIWQNMGYKSRCVHLGGHAVAEVLVDNNWLMIDVDNNSFFTNEKSEIQSVEELENTKAKHYNHYITRDFSLSELFFLVNKRLYLDLFTSKQNNAYSDSIPIPDLSGVNCMSLLPGAYIDLPVNDANNFFSNYAFCRIHIPNNIKGIIHIPFVIHHIEGNGIIYNFTRAMKAGAKVKPLFPGRYYVSSGGIDVFAYINPLLLKLDDSLHIELNTINNAELDISYRTNNLNSLANSDTASLPEGLSIYDLNPYIQYFERDNKTAESIEIETIDDFAQASCKLYQSVFNKSCNKRKVSMNILTLRTVLRNKKVSEIDFVQLVNTNHLVNPMLILINQADTSAVKASLQIMFSSY